MTRRKLGPAGAAATRLIRASKTGATRGVEPVAEAAGMRCEARAKARGRETAASAGVAPVAEAIAIRCRARAKAPAVRTTASGGVEPVADRWPKWPG